MPKKIIGALIFVFLIFGTSGCDALSFESSNQTDSSVTSQPTSQTQFASVSSSSNTSSEHLTNTSRPFKDQKVQGVPILYYHSIMEENGNKLKMPPDQFEAQMAYLQEKGYQSLTLDQLYQAEYLGGALPSKPFVITFDDGYIDNYTTAFPILKKYGFIASIFMISSYINEEGFLSWSQLKELAANGWEIEGHTANHLYLSKQDTKTVLNELESSKELLEKELGYPVNFFAYPYGDLNDKVAQAVKATGYVMAFTTERGWANNNVDAWHVHRVYCFADMGMSEFSRRLQNPNY